MNQGPWVTSPSPYRVGTQIDFIHPNICNVIMVQYLEPPMQFDRTPNFSPNKHEVFNLFDPPPHMFELQSSLFMSSCPQHTLCMPMEAIRRDEFVFHNHPIYIGLLPYVDIPLGIKLKTHIVYTKAPNFFNTTLSTTQSSKFAQVWSTLNESNSRFVKSHILLFSWWTCNWKRKKKLFFEGMSLIPSPKIWKFYVYWELPSLDTLNFGTTVSSQISMGFRFILIFFCVFLIFWLTTRCVFKLIRLTQPTVWIVKGLNS